MSRRERRMVAAFAGPAGGALQRGRTAARGSAAADSLRAAGCGRGRAVLGCARRVAPCAQFYVPPDENQRKANQRTAEKLGSLTRSVVGQAALWGGLIYLTVSGHLSWVFDSIFLLIGVVLVTPVIALGVFRFWAKRNLLQGTCANCGFPQTALKNSPPFSCMSCGSRIVPSESGEFELEFARDATVDVSAESVLDVEAEVEK
uniref:Uncharacterized protein n=1 Tax=Erythrolobus australicus TaxID=1077150 RepID=A0A7S1TM75_9RHOD|mmetsp:Transcript_4841/g.12975  ORF Transcript_4841/g.12975 Transcript_4841/m.12975 type:complete len:203 (+) Transcript_4841:207-815(+)